MAPWEDQWRKWQDPDPHSDPNPDPLVRGMDPRIQIRIRMHSKISWIRNTESEVIEIEWTDRKISL